VTKRRNEKEARAQLLLGLLLADINENECAAELFRSVLLYISDSVEARIELGIVCCRIEAYREMVESFRDAIRIDPQAVRVAISKEPEEMEHLRQILYVEEDALGPAASLTAIPSDILEAGELVTLACEHLTAGRDYEAVEALERSLRIDSTFPLAISLLALAYLLLGDLGRRQVATGSILWKISPQLCQFFLLS
jgi:tetratricopeptide (TPR) repeat protein